MTGGRLGRWACHDTMLRHGRACSTIWLRSLRHDTQQLARARCDTAGDSYDTTGWGPRHGLVCATIQPSARHDTTPCARPGHSGIAAWVQGVHLVHLTQFWTQCTVSESLFGTLFMNTVHEHCSRGFKKNK